MVFGDFWASLEGTCFSAPLIFQTVKPGSLPFTVMCLVCFKPSTSPQRDKSVPGKMTWGSPPGTATLRCPQLCWGAVCPSDRRDRNDHVEGGTRWHTGRWVIPGLSSRAGRQWVSSWGPRTEQVCRPFTLPFPKHARERGFLGAVGGGGLAHQRHRFWGTPPWMIQ